jgi:type II secretory pathway component GspD/PulD (secretin)
MRIAGSAPLVSLLLITACASSPRPAQDPTQNDAKPIAGAAVDRSADVSASGAPSSQDLAQDAERLRRQREMKKLLLEAHADRARELKENGRLREAAEEIEMARAIDPNDLGVKDLASEIAALLGDGPGETRTIAQILAQEHTLRVQQLKSEAEDLFDSGRLALLRQEYDKAVADLSLAVTSIKQAPYSIDWGGMDTQAAALLDRARAERRANAAAQRIAEQEAAHRTIREQEQAEALRRNAITQNMLDQAITAFNSAEYRAAQDFADQVLDIAPRNEQALAVRDAAFRASREKVRREYIEDKREEFAKWQEHLRELEIPWTDVITLPDKDNWRRITEIRRGRRGLDLSQKISFEEIALREQLAATNVFLGRYEGEESIATIIGAIQQVTNLPLVVDPAAEDAVSNNGVLFDIDFPNEITVTQALNFLTDVAGEDVTWTVRHEAVLVTTREKARGKPVVYNHDVQDLIMGLTDFTGPRIDRLRLLDDIEDDDGGGPFGGILETQRLIEIEDLATIIQENVSVGTWEDDGVTIEPGEGFILITHSPEVQQQVKDFLEDLRRFNSSLVTIESKFMTVGDNWIQEIGVDFRGLDSNELVDVTNGLEDMASRGLDNGGTGSEGQNAAGPPSSGFFYDDGGDGDFRGTTQHFFNDALGSALSTIGGFTFQLTFLDDMNVSAILRAIEKTTQFQLVNSQMLSVHNTQRAYVTVINQQAFIQDFDVEVAQFQAVADPQINVLHEGVVLDVRPTIHHSRKYLTLEIQPTVAKVVALRTFSTTLGGNTSPVDFQLPELEVQSVNTSAIIPDGGSILLGGLSNIRNIERRAEVPWLARVPVVGFLFKSEGYNDERESLMILIRASITDIREEVATRLERRY